MMHDSSCGCPDCKEFHPDRFDKRGESEMTKSAKQYILYDARAHDDPDGASVLDTAKTENEARRVSRQHRGEHALWYEYEVSGKDLLNGKPRYDL